MLAIAWRPEGWPEGDAIEGLTFLGFVGLEDPVRSGVREAIASCATAGIRTIMLTGDQRVTAEAVGRQLGLAPESIRSRVSPQDKLDLIAALQAEGEIVAMTGDGVNDAPALARADIGVAMGRQGTDIAREAADIVLTDDNFATIARAVQEGRVIYANLRKVIHFLFTCNLSEILAIFVAILLGFPAPLLPLQILWVNLVTDILPAMALIRDPAEPDVMRRPAAAPAGRPGHLALRTPHAGRRRAPECGRPRRLPVGGLAGWTGPPRDHHRVRRARPDPPAPGDELPLGAARLVATAAERPHLGRARGPRSRSVGGRGMDSARAPSRNGEPLGQ